MRAWHRGTLAGLTDEDPEVIVGHLAAVASDRRQPATPEAMDAWRASVGLLRSLARLLVSTDVQSTDWHYFLEFDIPRRSRRIDIVLIAHNVIIPIECKVGATRFDRAARWQAEQYALDMRDFHEGSRDHWIIPILVATQAHTTGQGFVFNSDERVQSVVLAAGDEFAELTYNAWVAARSPGAPSIEPVAWENSAYRPTPSIVDAACALYEGNDVREVNLSGAHNLDDTVLAILAFIRQCRNEQRRGIAFITGAPGSGKTLAGLQVVHEPEVVGTAGGAGVFLSGNRPLVEVISTALEDAAVRQKGLPRNEAKREVRTFIQHAYAFRNEYAENLDRVPPEHIILFDEAQRAWDALQVERWTKGRSRHSEPELFMEIMSRVPQWAVIIALVGNGQEINRGEAGLSEWGRALEQGHPEWLVMASPAVLEQDPSIPGGTLFDSSNDQAHDVQREPRLHLRMNVRSPRAERLNQWVDCLLNLDVEGARQARPDSREFPIVLTRDLEAARRWLRDRRGRGTDWTAGQCRCPTIAGMGPRNTGTSTGEILGGLVPQGHRRHPRFGPTGGSGH
jgi:hypothetical protein